MWRSFGSLVFQRFRSFSLIVFIFLMSSISAYSQSTTIYYEDWEDGVGRWFASNGVWEVGIPSIGPDSAHSGQKCAATILDGNYPSNANTRLESPISPVISLPSINSNEKIQLKFWHWFRNSDDKGELQISVDGSDWQTISKRPFQGTSYCWTQFVADLSEYAGSTIRLGFSFSSGNYYSDNGWYIDDILIEKKQVKFQNPEDFETGVGDWSADNGLWEVGIPTNGPPATHSGQNCIGTVLDKNYPENAATRLISPPTILPIVSPGEKIQLKFWHWFRNSDDKGELQISVDGSDWQTISKRPFQGTSYCWTQFVADLSEYAGSTIRLGFSFSSGNYYSDNGWYIDDILIEKKQVKFQNPEDFETGVGDWSADNGLWEVGIPTNGPPATHSGQNCIGTVLDKNYPENAATRLISPQITLKHKQGEIPILYFWHWFRLSDDQGYVQLSVNGGPWRTVAGPFSGKSDVWSQAPPVELSTYIDSTVSIAFSFFSGNYYSDNGWYIDDIRIEGIDTTSYRLDFITLTYQQIDASNFCDSSKVHSYVTVSDSSGNALSDLGVNNFSVKEDGEVQSPITVEHIGATQQPISVAMVLDRSSSMAGQPLVDAKNAAIDFVHKMADHDMGAVISFAADVVVDQEFTTDKDLLVTAIEAISNSESTHHYDGLMEAINQCGPLTGRKAIITLTDGKDGSSVTTIDSCIAAAQKAQLPIFTIGLLGGSGIDEEALKKIASETGGLYYFSPSSEKLAYIYNVIAEHILQNQYKITYSPRNTNGDGVTSRLVEITASYNGSTDSKSKSYIPAPCDTLVPFYPITVSDTIPPSQRFWLDLKVGKENQQVNDLFGIAFKLKYDENVLIFHTIKEDEFIGNDPVSHFEADSISGIIASGVSRKAGSGGVNGFGTVVKAEFEVRKNIADGTVAWFELLDVYAINSQGVEIRLDTLQYKIVVSSCLTTWPGDANNDGFVDEKDVLPIGFFWHTSGNESPCRQAAPFEWQPCCCVPWTPTAATYANSNGDGIIDEKDVLALGMNWHKAHSISKKRSATSLAFDSDSMLIDIPNTLQKGQEIDIRISVPETKDLFGFSFKAQFANYEFLEFLQIKPGGFLGGNLISFGDIDIENGIASLGQTKKSGAAGANGSGCVAIILLKVKDTAPENFRIKVHVTDITANDSQGTRLAYNDATVYFTSVNYQAIQLPTKFALEQNYPNPFNPETTISYQLPRATNVKLIVLNSVGQHVRTLVAEEKSAGRHIVRWNGLNGLGRKVSSGIYFYQLEAGEFTQMKKMILLQ